MRAEEEIAHLEEYANRLRDEIDTREQEHKILFSGIQDRLKRVSQRNQEVEKLTRTLNSEYFDQRRKHDQELKRLQEEKELLKLKGVSLKAELERVEDAKTIENRILEDLGQKRVKDYAGDFATKAANKEEALDRMKQQYRNVKNILEEETAILEGHVSQLSAEIFRLSQAQDMKITGVRTECEKLRRQTRAFMNLSTNLGNLAAGTAQPNEDETVELTDLDRLHYKMRDIDRLL